jgi:nicotinamidase-related amidase
MKLLVIDAQALLCTPKLYAFDRFVDTVSRLIAAARKNGAEVICVRHDDGADQPLSPGKPGYDVYEAFAPLPGEKVYDKRVNSCFRDTGLLDYLRTCGETDVMICGLQTDYCIDAAVKCGFEHGLHIIVPAYGNTTTDNDFLTGEESYRYHNEWMWPRRYADCVPLEEALRLLGE